MNNQIKISQIVVICKKLGENAWESQRKVDLSYDLRKGCSLRVQSRYSRPPEARFEHKNSESNTEPKSPVHNYEINNRMTATILKSFKIRTEQEQRDSWQNRSSSSVYVQSTLPTPEEGTNSKQIQKKEKHNTKASTRRTHRLAL